MKTFSILAIYYLKLDIRLFANLQIMPGAYMERYTGLKWVKRENLNLPKCFKGVLLVGPKIPSHSGDCALGERQLYAISVMEKG